MKSKLLVASLFVLTAGVVVGYPHAKGPPREPVAATVQPVAVAGTRPKVEVVFVLDTTSSMTGLIDAAKANIWSIATTMAQAQPAPDLRMGLVAFRDRGDAYVTKVVDLSSDLDSMYATLMDFRAEGGGDGPESVNAALHDAVHRISWSRDPKAYQVVFLVGDAPPHMDYQDDVPYPDTVRAATAKGIVVNTILAGNDTTTEAEWRKIAMSTQGEFFQVAATGAAVAVETPFDAEIAAVSKSLDETRLYFGDAETQRRLAAKEAATGKLHAEGSAASRAKRAAFNASAAGRDNAFGENELVDAVASGRVDLAKLEKADLPPALRELDADAQAKVVKQTGEKRAELSRELAALADKRRAYIEDNLAADATAGSLDQKLYDAVRTQAAEKGLRYDADKPAL